jgi:transposase
MAYDHATRKKVRAKYVQGLPLTSAADAAEVPYNTARNWKRQDAEAGDDWDIAKAARRMTKSGVEEMANQVLGELAEQFTATLQALKADKKMKTEVRARIMVQLMDGYNKAIAAATRAMPNANRLAVAMDVIKHLTDLFAARFPKLRPQFVSAVEQLGDDLVREFSSAGGR